MQGIAINNVLRVRRVKYGKKNMAQHLREYVMVTGSPCGNKQDWIEYAKTAGYTQVVMSDAVEQTEVVVSV